MSEATPSNPTDRRDAPAGDVPVATDHAPPTTAPRAVVVTPPAGDDDPFQRLHKMSTTAGLGSGDYVAISGTAVAALVLGIASAVVLSGGWVLLLVPVAGLVCGILSLVQVSQSNGTQTGRGIAVLGLLLSLGFGGSYVVRSTLDATRERADQTAIVDLVRGFGADLAAGKLDAAYARCTPEFQSHVSADLFESTLRPMQTSPVLGRFTGIDWNGVLSYSTNEVTGEPLANGMVFLNYSESPRPMRIAMGFQKVGGRWEIDQMPSLISPPKPKKAPPPKQAVPLGPMLPTAG